jgi:hypothetical protein
MHKMLDRIDLIEDFEQEDYESKCGKLLKNKKRFTKYLKLKYQKHHYKDFRSVGYKTQPNRKGTLTFVLDYLKIAYIKHRFVILQI